MYKLFSLLIRFSDESRSFIAILCIIKCVRDFRHTLEHVAGGERTGLKGGVWLRRVDDEAAVSASNRPQLSTVLGSQSLEMPFPTLLSCKLGLKSFAGTAYRKDAILLFSDCPGAAFEHVSINICAKPTGDP